jgi:hypothetical protein
VPDDVRSLLDAGCDRGHWLAYVRGHRSIERLRGVDVSEGRIAEARDRYPGLDFRAEPLEAIGSRNETAEVVTCLEVLEHIPDWLPVLDALLAIAERRVVITVPYREEIQQTNCIHCGKLTPQFGHLRSYDEGSFPKRDGWRLSFGFIKDYGIGASTARRIYRRLRPRRGWMVACYDAQPG